MAAVTIDLGRAARVDPVTVLTTAVALFFLLRFRMNSSSLIARGAIVGVVAQGL